MDYSWQTLLAFAGTTGLFTTALNQFFEWLRDRSKARFTRREQAAYLALRLAVQLEAYAFRCLTFIVDNTQMEAPPDREFPDWKTNLPMLDDFPVDPEGWRSLELRLCNRVLSLANRISDSQLTIDFCFDFDPDALEDTLAAEAGKRGLDAWDIAAALRTQYRVAPNVLADDYRKRLTEFLEASKFALNERTPRTKDLLSHIN